MKRLASLFRSKWLLAAAGVAVLLTGTNARLVTGNAVPTWDADHAFASWFSLVADFARDGQFLLWNPWTNGGAPDFTDPQFGAFSPLTVIYGAVAGGSLLAFNIFWLLVWLGGGLGMLVLARHLKAPPWGGFIVALAFVYSGFMTGHAQHTPVILVFSTMPWIIWRIDRGMQQGRLWPWIEAGAALGLAALAGYPGMVMAVGGYAVMWALGRTLMTPAEPRAESARRRGLSRPSSLALRVAMLVFVAVIVASPTYIAFVIEGVGYSDRAGALARDYAVASNALDPGALATFSTSMLSILQWRSDLWASTDISSSSIYAGVLTTCLAGFAIVVGRRRRWYWWLVMLAAAGVALAVGPALPFRGWLYDLVPPTRYFRHPSIFRSYYIFTVMVLAVYGSRHLQGMLQRAAQTKTRAWDEASRDERHWRVLLVSGLATAVAAAIAYWSVAAPRIGPAGNIALAPWLAVVAALAMCARLKTARFAPLAMLVVVAVVDAIVTSRVTAFTIASEHPQALAAWRWVKDNRSTQLDLEDLDRIRFLPISNGHTNKHLGVKLAVLSAYTPNENRIHLQWAGDPVLSPSVIGVDRIWFAPVGTTPTVLPAFSEFTKFKERAAALGGMPAVVHSREAMLSAEHESLASSISSSTAPLAVSLPYTLLRYAPRQLALRVTVPEAGYVIVSDRWARGWRASVDGTESPVMGANFIFRGIAVPAGTHEIVMEYNPFGFPWLLIGSWATVLLVLAGSFAAGIRALPWSARRLVQRPSSTA